MSRSKSSVVTAALIAAAIVLPEHAQADGGDLAAGLFGGLIAGAIVGNALAPRGPEPVYVAPEPGKPHPPGGPSCRVSSKRGGRAGARSRQYHQRRLALRDRRFPFPFGE